MSSRIVTEVFGRSPMNPQQLTWCVLIDGRHMRALPTRPLQLHRGEGRIRTFKSEKAAQRAALKELRRRNLEKPTEAA